MPARRRQTGLDETAVSGLRDKLAAGGRPPRVGISGSQFPAGTTGAVVRVGDPATDGEDYVTVRVKLGSTTDELTFAPAELTLPGATPRPARAARPARDDAPAPSDPAPPSTPPEVRAGSTHDVPPPAARPAPAKKSSSTGNPAPADRPAAKAARASARPDPAGAAPRSAARSRRSAPQKVTLTVTSDGSDWTVSAQRGARTVLKRIPVLPGTVGAIADLLGDDALLEAVASVNDSAREHAESRAAQLRAELADLDRVIASHRKPTRR